MTMTPFFMPRSRQSQRTVPRASVLRRALTFSLEPSCNAAFKRSPTVCTTGPEQQEESNMAVPPNPLRNVKLAPLAA